MEITLDPNFLNQLSRLGPFALVWLFFVKGGWVILIFVGMRLWWLLRLYRLQAKYARSIEYVLLAIDIPKDSEQSPKAMEQVFATISGAHMPLNKKEKYLMGVIQLSFSFEIISIDGYIQFLIRSPKFFRDLVEGAVYAHYPDAEITEVNDYTQEIASQFPNDQYNLWGSELQLTDNQALPLRTYESFEDRLTQEFKDPLAGVLETMSRIQKGEQVWFQIIVVPTDNAWVKKTLAYAYKLAGKKALGETKKAWYSGIFDFLYNIPDWIGFLQTDGTTSKQDQGLDFRVLNLTPGQRGTIEAIERKASKIGFVCKLRLLYISPHEKFQSKRVISSVFGGLKQFGDLTSNALKPNNRTKTQLVYFNAESRTDARRRRIINNYKARSWYFGSKYFILNTEELATIYHFPSITIKTPSLKRTETKKSDAPVQLPSGEEQVTQKAEDDLRQQLANLNLDNDFYEKRYARVKESEVRRRKEKIMQELKQEQQSDIPDNLPLPR